MESRSVAIKRVRALHQKKYRAEARMFLVQGRKLVAEALASRLVIERVFATATAAERLADVRVTIWPDHDMERIGTLDSGNEAVAVLRMPDPMPFTPLGEKELVLALDGVNDPGNLGTILRAADWFGIDRVFLGAGSVDVFNPKCVQASMGAVLRVAAIEVDLPTGIERLKAEGAAIYRAEMRGADVFTTELQRPAVLVLGSESHGISPGVLAAGGTSITIPGSGRSESLNVAMAASVLSAEFFRKR